MTQFVRIERSSNEVATIRIDRPKVNALTVELLAELVEAASQLAQDRSVRAVVIWGGPKIFSAGIDVGGFVDHSAPSFGDVARRFNRGINAINAINAERPADEGIPSSDLVRKFNRWMDTTDDASSTDEGIPSLGGLVRQFSHWITAIERLPQITVSAVNGTALGTGLDLALATDFRVAAEDATFAQSEIKVGIVPGCGASYFLPRLVGLAKARELIFNGDTLDAEEALRIGLVSTVCAPEETYGAALEMASKFAAGPAALRFAKQALRASMDLPLDEAIIQEADCAATAIATEDAAIGLSSFLGRNSNEITFTGR